MTDFTTDIQESGATTGEVVGEAVESAVEAAGEKVESAVDAVEGVVEESVDAVLPSEEVADPYGEALREQNALKDKAAQGESDFKESLHDLVAPAKGELQGEANELETLIDAVTLDDTQKEVSAQNAGQDASLPQLEHESYSGQIFWLAVTFILLYLLMAKSVLPRIHEVLEKRRHRIEHDLDQAERLAQESAESKADYERLHAESLARSQQMIADTEASIRQASDEEHEKLDAELAERLVEADKAIVKAAADVKKKLKPTAESVAQEIVKAMTGSGAADKKVADVVAKVKW